MQTPRLRNSDGLLYRCSLRLDDDDRDVAPPYALNEDPGTYEGGLRAYNLQGPDLHFRVDYSNITILTSDAIHGRNNKPKNHATYTRGHEWTDSDYVRIPQNDVVRLDWLGTVGKFIGAIMFGKLEGHGGLPFALADFPDDMEFYMLAKTRSEQPEGSKPRMDVYLRSYSGRVFATPYEFARHAMWLMEGMPKEGNSTACVCKYCARVVDPRTGKTSVASQTDISSELRILSGCPTQKDLLRFGHLLRI